MEVNGANGAPPQMCSISEDKAEDARKKAEFRLCCSDSSSYV